MGTDHRWIARVQFLRELWSRRDRLWVVDGGIEPALVLDSPSLGTPLRTLINDFLPPEDAGNRVTVAGLGKESLYGREGVQASSCEALEQKVREGTTLDDWDVAIFDLGWGAFLEQLELEPNENPESLQSPESTGQHSSLLKHVLSQLQDDLTKSAYSPKCVAIWLPAEENDDRPAEVYNYLAQLDLEARIYGLAGPEVAAVYEFGESSGTGESESGEVEIGFDNQLGEEDPTCSHILAVLGNLDLPEGMTWMELPSREELQMTLPRLVELQEADESKESEVVGSSPAPADFSGIERRVQESRIFGEQRSEDEDQARKTKTEIEALKAELQGARRRADNAELEQQRLLDELESLRSASGAKSEVANMLLDGESTSPRLDEALAKEQAMRWEVDRLRAQVADLRGRSVSNLEAEVASLRAIIAATSTTAAPSPEGGVKSSKAPDEKRDDPASTFAVSKSVRDEPRSLARSFVGEVNPRTKSFSEIERLLARLERGGLSSLVLRKELLRLRERLVKESDPLNS